jgi:hypothetical protein
VQLPNTKVACPLPEKSFMFGHVALKLLFLIVKTRLMHGHAGLTGDVDPLHMKFNL